MKYSNNVDNIEKPVRIGITRNKFSFYYTNNIKRKMILNFFNNGIDR
jgi:hypothetical protein|nr:MAG TPA: hypothetical protein [Caudoviricetes sp.]